MKSSVMVCLVGNCETKFQTNIVAIMKGISAHSQWDAHLIPNMIGFHVLKSTMFSNQKLVLKIF